MGEGQMGENCLGEGGMRKCVSEGVTECNEEEEVGRVWLMQD